MSERHDWATYDLQILAVVAASRGSLPLRAVARQLDYWYREVPDGEEFALAAGRLVQSGLVAYGRGALSPTPRALELLHRASAADPESLVEILSAELALPPAFGLPLEGAAGLWESAVAESQQSLRARLARRIAGRRVSSWQRYIRP